MNPQQLVLALSLVGFAPGFAAAQPEGVTTKPGEPKRLEIGKKAVATDTKMTGTDGKEYSIDGVRGKNGTLVIFSCNTCPWVVAWEDRIASIGNGAKEQGFGVIVINSNSTEVQPGDSMEEMKKRAKERAFNFPYVVDSTSDVARAYGATKTPEVFLFDTSMKLAYYGAIDDNAKNPDEVESAYLTDAMAALKAGEEIAVTETKAIGCTIKFRPVAKAKVERAEKTQPSQPR